MGELSRHQRVQGSRAQYAPGSPRFPSLPPERADGEGLAAEVGHVGEQRPEFSLRWAICLVPRCAVSWTMRFVLRTQTAHPVESDRVWSR